MKKNILIIIVSSLIIACFIYFNYFYTNKGIFLKYCNIAYQNNKNDVNQGIKECTNSKEFKELNEKEQINCMRDLLNEYLNTNKIKDLSYDEDGMLFSFKYENGYLGGVKLKDFDPYMN